ncbi:MAG TPA: VOC family protein [Thermoanaerobaculia bacterium]|nr:VOC family protein [Thermoanaerobaculia bacterium]
MSREFHSLIPLIHVRNVPASVAFYEKLGFRLAYSHKEEKETEISWALMQSGGAQIMLARATEAERGIVTALYANDVDAKHKEIVANGVNPGPLEHPFFRPRGYFRLEDPDGYVLNITYPERG